MAETSILSKYPNYEANIGIEVHVQLNTKSKIFCKCSNGFSHEPNKNICQVCSGQPGVLPVLNQEVLVSAIKAGLATNCTISNFNQFDRKHYFYPDLPKNYQITQQRNPICINGYIPIKLDNGAIKHIPIVRIHMEEDAGKNMHSQFSNESFVDLNRAGTPLLEVVTSPDIANEIEAREYLKQLRLSMLYLGITTGNMEEGAFRADANISVRPKGSNTLGTKCELKNINSFKFISDGIAYEIDRQIKEIEAGRRIIQETRLWNTKEQKTYVMRTKEELADYRYIEDPDLPYIELPQETIDKIKLEMPELPYKKLERFTTALGLTEYEAEILVNDLELANYFETAQKYTNSKHLINWILRNLLGLLKDLKITLKECKITPEKLAGLVDLFDKNVINNKAAQEVFNIMSQTGQEPMAIVKEKGLEQIEDTQETERIIKEIIDANPSQTAEYKAGNERILPFFVGQAMKATKGKGNPAMINQILKKLLS